MIDSTRVSANAITKAIGRIVCVALFSLMLTACTRGVQWEEEVPLNTGETIWVKRSGTYTLQAETGGLKPVWGADWRSTIEFTYKGKRYSYTGDAFIQLLAIGPDLSPTLVADARGWGNKNLYPCVTPYYVQFVPDKSGKNWSWGLQISPWLYNLPTNLIIGIAPLDLDQRRVGATDRQQFNASLLVLENYRRIDQLFKPENCVERN